MLAWIEHFFHPTAENELSTHLFGRTINANLNPDEHKIFNQAVEAFREGHMCKAFEYYFSSLENFSAGVSNQNINFHYENDDLHFELYQGTAVIHGLITDKVFQADCVISKTEALNVASKRHILERNDLLTYIRYYIHGDYLKCKLYLDNTTMTPQKIFYPLRELVLNADYEKEYLHYHFKQKELVASEHLMAVDEDELHIKYDAMQRWISECHDELRQLPNNDNISTVSFTLLRLLFQIDYLLVPHLDIMQELFEKINSFFTDDERLVEQKNDELLTFIEKLQQLPFEKFKQNFYRAKYTFSPLEHSTTEEVNQFIEASLEKFRWFKHHRYEHVAATISRYIALYVLYNYGVHPSYRALLHLLVETQNSSYFVTLGYTPYYHQDTQHFEQKAITKKIVAIISPYQEKYSSLIPFGDALNYTTLEEFSHSFYRQLQALDYTEL